MQPVDHRCGLYATCGHFLTVETFCDAFGVVAGPHQSVIDFHLTITCVFGKWVLKLDKLRSHGMENMRHTVTG